MSKTRAHREDTGTLAPARRLDDGRVVLDAAMTRCGVFVYLNSDGSSRREYRPPAEVFAQASMDSLALVPVTDDHPPVMVTAANASKYTVGQVSEAIRRDGSHLAGKIVINHADTIKRMDSGKREVSCGYDCDLEMVPGVSPEGEHYDAVQSNIVYNHLAIVERGRAGSARVRMDGAFQVTEPTVDVPQPKDRDGASCWVSSNDMTVDDLHAAVSRALKAQPGVTVTASLRKDAVDSQTRRVARGDGTVRFMHSTDVYVQVASRSMTSSALTSLLSEALSASPDFRVRTDSIPTKESQIMDLTQALAAYAAAQKELGAAIAATATEKTRADAAEKTRADLEKQLVEAQSATATEKARADAAEKTRADAEKARKDAADGFTAQVNARVALITSAAGVLGRNDKAEVLGSDGKTPIDLSKLNDRDIRTTVIERLDGVKTPAERSDDAVAYAFELAVARAEKSGAALGNARTIILTGTAPHADAAPVDETKAESAMKSRARNAWKIDTKETK